MLRYVVQRYVCRLFPNSVNSQKIYESCVKAGNELIINLANNSHPESQ